jgi:hypothetical protein
MKVLAGFFIAMIERHPALGYIGAGVSTGSGFWVLVEKATKLGALVSVVIGIAVGLVTYRVQRAQEKKLKRERQPLD